MSDMEFMLTYDRPVGGINNEKEEKIEKKKEQRSTQQRTYSVVGVVVFLSEQL